MGVEIPFNRDFECVHGELVSVSPMIRRMVAPNPSPFSFKGTNSYVIGQGSVALLDPGPAIGEHVEALLGALEGEEISHLVITHTHLDHSPAARLIQQKISVETHGYGPHAGGRHAVGDKVEEGGDRDFRPDHELRHGDKIEGDGWSLEAVHTPGHTSNHLCYALSAEGALFTGDHVMGWSTTVVIPPDGDMGDYLESLRKVRDGGDSVLWPTHGPAVREPRPFVSACIAHREGRELQIYNCLDSGLETVADMVARMYVDVDKRLHTAAARSVLAHLVHMVESGRVLSDGAPGLDARFTPAASA